MGPLAALCALAYRLHRAFGLYLDDKAACLRQTPRVRPTLLFIPDGDSKMLTRTALFCAVIGMAASAAPMLGNARGYVDVEIAPPVARVEVIPGARVGYAWAPGYYNYYGHRHVWVDGRYIRQRSGHHWTADRWEQRGERWHHEAGRWDHD
jgi:hypothetical protein